MFGAAPFGHAQFGTAGHKTVFASPASLGTIVSFGAPTGDWVYETQAASLGYVLTFGSPTGVGNIHYPKSLGSVVRFGVPSTPGDSAAEAESLGYVARFGDPIGIKFKRRALA